LEDLEQIRQLFVEYKTVLDKQDFAAYGALFAADGEFIATPRRRACRQARGPAAIQALVEAMPGSPARIRTGRGLSCRHQPADRARHR